MCGFVGVFGERASLATLVAGAKTISHRGPDGIGAWIDRNGCIDILEGDAVQDLSKQESTNANIHLRLSIIDLVGGSQPVWSKDGAIILSFNGEVYNYVELAGQMQDCPNPASDTSVLVHGISRDGLGFLDRVNGMFAFALYDVRSETLYLGRDRLGIKPLFYRINNGRVSYGSEIKAVNAVSDELPSPSLSAIAEYWRSGYVIGDDTMFNGVMEVTPGTVVSFQGGKRLDTIRFWNASDYSKSDRDFSPHVLEDLIRDSVRLRERSDVPTAVYVSGGLDSSTIAGLSCSSKTGYHGIWRAGSETDESAWAREVATNHGIDLRLVSLEDHFERGLQRILENAIRRMDQPMVGPGILAQMALAEAVGSDFKVVLGGQGGDELFGGYRRTIPTILTSLVRNAVSKRSLTPLWTALALSLQLTPRELQDAARRRLRPPISLVLDNQAFENVHASSELSQGKVADISGYLKALLSVEDALSMGFGLEARVPLLDHRIVEYALSISDRIQLDHASEQKWMLRSVARKIVPTSVTSRTDKIGFTPDRSFWWSGWVPNALNRIMSDDSGPIAALLTSTDRDRLRLAVARRDQTYRVELWRALCLDCWFRAYGLSL